MTLKNREPMTFVIPKDEPAPPPAAARPSAKKAKKPPKKTKPPKPEPAIPVVEERSAVVARIPHSLHLRAKMVALVKRMDLQVWIEQAMREKLEREGEAK